jgi:PKD repeat protein
MKIFNNCIIVLLLLACISCRKKEYPESTKEGSPVFNCSMMINGAPITIEAGVNDYYMYSSFQQDSSGVYGFIAGLKQTNCTTCPNSLQIQINDFKISPVNALTQIDSLLPKNYDYMQSNAAAYFTAQFQSSYNKPVNSSSYLWNFGDGSTSTLTNPTHIYKRAGKYSVSLKVTGTNSCESSIYSIQNIGTINYKFRTQIDADSTAGNTINFSAINSQGTGPYLYLWNFGDGTSISTSANPSHTYQYTGAYPVTLRVIDTFNGDTAYAKYNTVTQGDISSCATNYTVSAVNLSANALGLSNIIVKWIDANGMEYTSKNSLQPGNSYFTIVSVQDYQNNNNNERTKKLHVKFKCTVYNGSNSIQLDNADAFINIAYK